MLKALHSLSERRPLPQKERELYDSARHLVVNEFAVALNVARATGEDTVDFCLTPPAGSPSQIMLFPHFTAPACI